MWNGKEYILTKNNMIWCIDQNITIVLSRRIGTLGFIERFFRTLFEKAKKIIVNENIELKSGDIGSGEQAQNKLSVC